MALTAEQRKQRDAHLIEWIRSFVRKYGFAPSVREVGEAFGLSSPSTVADWLNRLKRDGQVNWVEGETRTLHVVRRRKPKQQ